MPEFILDTSGNVPIHGRRTIPNPAEFTAWEHLDSFTQGYIEALFFTESEPGTDRDSHDPETQSSLPGDVGFSDLAPETLAQIIADCAAFQKANVALLESAFERDYDDCQAGSDFWFTRNGHGVGFWDREALEPDSEEYEKLTDAIRENNEEWCKAGSLSGGYHSQKWNELVSARNALEAESIGHKLSSAAKSFGEVWVYLADDMKVYLS